MKDTFLLGLIQNAALLLAFSMLYDYFWASNRKKITILFQIIAGVIVGLMAITLIMTTWTFRQGLFFDTRSVLMSVTGLFMGPITTIVAVIVAAGYRLYIGGDGVWMGTSVILFSGLIGVAWKSFRPQWRKTPLKDLIAMGIAVHIVMLFCTFFLPTHLFWSTLQRITLPVILLYPSATVLLGLLMKRQSEAWKIKRELDNSERRWRFALEGAGDGVWDWDVKTKHVYYSPRWKSMLGYASNEIENHIDSWEKLLYPEDMPAINVEIEKLLDGKTEDYAITYRMICKDGSLKWILDRGKAIERDEDGKALRCIGTHTDVTMAKSNEEALRQMTQYTESILQAIPSFIFIIDAHFIFCEVKSGNNKDYYMPVDDFINKSIYEIFPGDVSLSAQECLSAVIRTGKMQKFEYKLNENSERRYYECSILPFVDGKFIALINEITQRIKFEKSLKESKEKLKNFAAHLQIVREEERKMLAQEIHDQLGQILIAMKIDTGLLAIKLKRHVITDEDVHQLFPELEKINNFIDNAINTSRKIMSELHSEILDLLGIEDAIAVQINKFEERTHIRPDFKCCKTKIILNKEKTIALYRIFQEAMNNIALHSKATEVKVTLKKEDENIVLSIQDNGVGFHTGKQKSPRSYGLMGMHERALFLDGELEIESQSGGGTNVTIKIPIVSENTTKTHD